MARMIKGTGFGVLGLAAGLASQMLSAQALGLPASDPVGIGRSGTGVAFGQSLEAASLNPALLVTLKDPRSAFVSGGLEMQSSQTTLLSTRNTLWSTDRNRMVPAMGAAWRLNDAVVLGVKLDLPFARHAAMPDESSTRFQQQAMKLSAHRLEFQGGWALTPNWSVGLGLGMAKVRYSSEAALRVNLPGRVGTPVSASNPVQAIMELPMTQSGQANVLTYSLGARWAINPRWTLGLGYQGPIRADLSLAAGAADREPVYVDTDGFGTPEIGSQSLGPAMMNHMIALPGNGRISLPARASLGVRQRYNQFLTWELDLRYVAGGNLELPSQPSLRTPSGVVSTPGIQRSPRNGYGFSGAVELTLTKRWTARAGVEFLSGLMDGSTPEPFVGGAPTAAFSGGVSYKAMGGEWSLGYQFRQSKDLNSSHLDGVWTSGGYYTSGTPMAVEGMGHLMALGFKKAF